LWWKVSVEAAAVVVAHETRELLRRAAAMLAVVASGNESCLRHQRSAVLVRPWRWPLGLVAAAALVLRVQRATVDQANLRATHGSEPFISLAVELDNQAIMQIKAAPATRITCQWWQSMVAVAVLMHRLEMLAQKVFVVAVAVAVAVVWQRPPPMVALAVHRNRTHQFQADWEHILMTLRLVAVVLRVRLAAVTVRLAQVMRAAAVVGQIILGLAASAALAA